YTPVAGLLELRQAIVEKFKRDNNIDFAVENIVVSNGSKQSFANLCFALLNPGDEVIIFSPYWVSHFEIVRMTGGTPVEVKAGISQDFKITPQQLQKALTNKTKMIVFSSPCNPTGSVFSKEDLDGFAEVLHNHPDVIIVSDEIYEYINFTGKHVSIGSIQSVADRTVTLNGFAKGFAMTGWRIGYMGAPKQIAEACTKVQGQVTSGASSFGQYASSVALRSDLKPTFEMVKAFKKRRDLLISLVKDIKGIKYNKPEGAFYLFPDISAFLGKSYGKIKIKTAQDLCEYLLNHAHVALVGGEGFGEPNCLRISYAASEEDIRKAINRIKEALAELN
ncbi:MAG: pyridoxal phosphate-dependent aminotransferase, partial [Saprospiraceae bacterium]|nr:pyridoxal phosphate-dependent aminotransferase [Saprospiraceae bacterium]